MNARTRKFEARGTADKGGLPENEDTEVSTHTYPTKMYQSLAMVAEAYRVHS